MEKILTREESDALFRATQQGQSQAKKYLKFRCSDSRPDRQ